jgi:hypothetical protein
VPAPVEAALRDEFFGSIARFDHAGVERAVTPEFELLEDAARLSLPQFRAFLQSLQGKAALAHRFDGFTTVVRGPVAWTSYRNHGTPAAGARRWSGWRLRGVGRRHAQFPARREHAAVRAGGQPRRAARMAAR